MKPQRIVIALVAFALFGGVVWLDYKLQRPWASLAVLVPLAALAQAEVYPLLRRTGVPSWAGLGVGLASALLLLRGFGGVLGLDLGETRALVAFLLAAGLVFPLAATMFGEAGRLRDGRDDFQRAAGTALGLFLVWYLLSFLLELRLLDSGDGTTRLGLVWTIVLILAVKVGDSTAYLVGRSIGVTPLSWVSPRKTWEGSAGSVVGSVAATLLSGLPFGLNLWQLLGFALVVNVAGQLGDLLESLLKRRAGVKDSGTFLKEMGGFLDLQDSLLLAAPAAYLYVILTT